jgi:uncharacterized ferredoxin-like protein
MIKEEFIRQKAVVQIAEAMMVAARTAPKARGLDSLEIGMLTADKFEPLLAKMHEIADREGMPFFKRDAANLQQSQALVLLGTGIEPRKLKSCGFCGHTDCNGKGDFADAPCAFNSIDLGIATGVAVAVASAHHADCRIMFSVGKAAIELGLLGNETKIILGIPLSVSAKSPFFDRPAL